MNFYNEIDDYAADWLQNLINADLITPGRVERRSITDLTEKDLLGVTQAHFFAGIGVWSAALRSAGWPDDISVWTGSCPCQPWSAAGRGGGIDDPRHLWPSWFKLIDACRPAVVFGEQVASKTGLEWFDLVSSDLEGAGYSTRAVDLPAASVGAPHIRQRLFFAGIRNEGLADYHSLGLRARRSGEAGKGPQQPSRFCADNVMAHSSSTRLEVFGEQQARTERQTAERSGPSRLVDDASLPRSGRDTGTVPGAETSPGRSGHVYRYLPNELIPASAVGGFWRSADWVICRDGKARPTQPGIEPLTHGSPTRMGSAGTMETRPRTGRLRGYGNAIVRQVAQAFIEAVMECLHEEQQ